MTVALDRNQLMSLVEIIMNPKPGNVSEVDQALFDFCAGSPDPVKSMWLITECTDDMTDAEIADRALSFPARSVEDIPFSEMPENHPVRRILESR